MAGLTPFSTVGPFFKLLLRDRADQSVDVLASDATHGERITIAGTLLDGAGAPIDDGLIEIWQADADGHYAGVQDADRRSSNAGFSGFGRIATGAPGTFAFDTTKPGRVPGTDGRLQAPHILLSVMARGIMSRCWTRIYFDDEPSNGEDDILKRVPADRRHTLIARRTAPGHYRFDIVVQGEDETVFFDA
jgi:protocatechuate 3,4-dioxygenase alpha subunit